MLGYCIVFLSTCYYLALIAMDTVSQVKLDSKTVGFSENRFNFQGVKHQRLSLTHKKRASLMHMPSLQTLFLFFFSNSKLVEEELMPFYSAFCVSGSIWCHFIHKQDHSVLSCLSCLAY